MYRNSEGYYDPTAGAAMSMAMKEYKNKQKNNWKRRYQLKTRKKVYVVSPFAGDIEWNRDAAVRYCRYVIKRGAQPVASHLLYPQMLDERNPNSREMGLMFGLSLLVVLCQDLVQIKMRYFDRYAAANSSPLAYSFS